MVTSSSHPRLLTLAPMSHTAIEPWKMTEDIAPSLPRSDRPAFIHTYPTRALRSKVRPGKAEHEMQVAAREPECIRKKTEVFIDFYDLPPVLKEGILHVMLVPETRTATAGKSNTLSPPLTFHSPILESRGDPGTNGYGPTLTRLRGVYMNSRVYIPGGTPPFETEVVTAFQRVCQEEYLNLCQPANPASAAHAHAAVRAGYIRSPANSLSVFLPLRGGGGSPSRPGPGEEKEATKNGTAGLVNGTGVHDTLKAPLSRRRSPVPYPARAPPHAPATAALLPIWVAAQWWRWGGGSVVVDAVMGVGGFRGGGWGGVGVGGGRRKGKDREHERTDKTLALQSRTTAWESSVLAREQCRRSGGARLARRLAWLARGVCWIASITDGMELGLGIAISIIVGPCAVSASTLRGGVRLPHHLAWPWQAQGRLAIYLSFPY
ncbi:hypothetical protein JB92DRAFT_2836633 [Gautieria morchelliformis]|nr:hypothetical protein JB92DRAFT_2836633 [Gautieria morchelliformis]